MLTRSEQTSKTPTESVKKINWIHKNIQCKHVQEIDAGLSEVVCDGCGETVPLSHDGGVQKKAITVSKQLTITGEPAPTRIQKPRVNLDLPFTTRYSRIGKIGTNCLQDFLR